jgi:hypothetical protein
MRSKSKNIFTTYKLYTSSTQHLLGKIPPISTAAPSAPEKARVLEERSEWKDIDI